MSIDPKLMKAILAMDSYNRGYNAGITFGSDPQNSEAIPNATKIGNYIVIANSTLAFDEADKDSGFYAIAYQDNSTGETVISYRGTDELTGVGTDFGSDFWNGYGGGVGVAETDQAGLAFAFYRAVVDQQTGTTGSDPFSANNISTTGHSLGGGLAGLVAGVYGVNGILFDNMAFEDAANATWRVSWAPPESGIIRNVYVRDAVYGGYDHSADLPDFSSLRTMYLEGQFLSLNLTGQQTPQTPMGLGPDVDLPGTDSGIAGGGLHSMAALAIRMYANEPGVATDWLYASKYFWPMMYDDAFAGQVVPAAITGQLAADQQYSDILRNIIAYSAIDEGVRVYGDTGIRAFYNDANDLGKALQETAPSSLITDHADEISKVLVQYAAELAADKILQSLHPDVLGGVLAYDAVDHTLTVDFSDALWNLGANGTPPMIGRAALFQALLDDTGRAASIRDNMQFLWGDGTANVIERVVLSTTTANAVTLQAASADKVTLFVGSEGDDTIKPLNGNTLIQGGAGNDTVDYNNLSHGVEIHANQWADKGVDGRDLFVGIENVIGSSFNDTFYGGYGGNDTLNGGAGIDTVDYTYGSTVGGTGVQIVNGTSVTKVGGEIDTLVSIEKFIGTSANDNKLAPRLRSMTRAA